MFGWRWRYARFHSSYLLASLATGLLSGLFAGKYVALGFDAATLIVAAMLLLGGMRSRRWWSLVVLCVAGMLLGAMRGGYVEASYRSYDSVVGTRQVVIGTVSSDSEKSQGTQRVTMTGIRIGEVAYPGAMYISLRSDKTIMRGDRIAVYGMVRDGFATYGAALSGGVLRDSIRSPDLIRDVRETFSNSLRRVVVEPIASLGLGFVVGQRSSLPVALDEQLKVVGLTHIVVASGYNLTILVRFMMRLASRHSRYVALILSLIAVILFVLFSGFSPSMNRAVIVTVLSLCAWYIGRRFHPVFLILYVSASTAFWNPMYIWADFGWYLSFFAFAGILIVAPLLMAAAYQRRSPSPFEQLITETISAELMVLPLIAFAFGSLPVFGLISNVLVAPLIPFAMALTTMTGVLAMTFGSLASIVALPTMIVIGYMIAVVEWLASIPFAVQTFSLSLPFLLMWYVILGASSIIAAVRLGYNFRYQDHQTEV